VQGTQVKRCRRFTQRNRFNLRQVYEFAACTVGCQIEEHYSKRAGKLMDEWAKDGITGRLLFCERGPEAVHTQRQNFVETYKRRKITPLVRRAWRSAKKNRGRVHVLY